MSMLTIHDLLEDATYRAYIKRRPHLPAHYTPDKLPFRLMVKLKGEPQWRMRRFGTYDEMFLAFKKLLPKLQDAALQIPGTGDTPPNRVVKIKGKFFTNGKGERLQVTKLVPWQPKIPADEFEEHHWCNYCRRPTVFKRFTRHHALSARKTGGVPIDPSLHRCTICGASENIVNIRRK